MSIAILSGNSGVPAIFTTSTYPRPLLNTTANLNESQVNSNTFFFSCTIKLESLLSQVEILDFKVCELAFLPSCCREGFHRRFILINNKACVWSLPLKRRPSCEAYPDTFACAFLPRNEISDPLSTVGLKKA